MGRLLPGPASPTHQVAGVALGRFAMVDGRPQDEAWVAEQMVANFEPGTVPLLHRHHGLPAGYLHSLRADGPDLHFQATISPYPDIVAALRQGHGISIEYVTAYKRADGQWPVWVTLTTRQQAYPYFRGTTGNGPTLLGVALSDNPAARGSVAWIVRPAGG